MIEVIILKYSLPEYENECIQQVLETVDSKKTPYHLTVYDNFPEDLHISAAWNKTIERTDAEYICLLNSDTVPRGDWLEKLAKVFKEKDKVGAVGPLTSNTSGSQGGYKGPLKKKKIRKANQINGFCLLFPKKVWKEAGKFDERFHLYGEENDLIDRIKLKGYNIYVREDAFVYHYGKKTMKDVSGPIKGKDVQKIHEESKKIYNKKKNAYRNNRK